MAPNYSLFTIPAVLVVALIPHGYSIYLITKNNNGKWDNASPRSTGNRGQVEKSVPKDIYRKFERCRATHDNILENMPFIVGAFLAGIITKLDADWMNQMSVAYLASRILYAFSYVQVSSQKLAPTRTFFYLVGNVILMWIYIRAGKVVMKGLP